MPEPLKREDLTRANRRPFPEALCHHCAAPPRYVRTATSVFILCPLLPERYPPQPVLECRMYRPLRPGASPE